MFAIPRSSNGPKPFYASPGVTTINISKNGISSKRMKNDFSQKFFWFDNIVPNQQNKWLGFLVEKKIATLHRHKSGKFCKLSKSCVFFRLAWGFCARLQKGSQWSSRSNFRKCIISRVVSFLCKASTYDDRMNLRLQANQPKIGQIIDSLWSKQHKVLAPRGPRKWCSKLQLELENQPKLF